MFASSVLLNRARKSKRVAESAPLGSGSCGHKERESREAAVKPRAISLPSQRCCYCTVCTEFRLTTGSTC